MSAVPGQHPIITILLIPLCLISISFSMHRRLRYDTLCDLRYEGFGETLYFHLFNMHIINVVLRSVKKYLPQSPEMRSPAADLPHALQSLFPSTPDYTICGIYNHNL